MHFNRTPQPLLFTWKSFSWNRLSQSHYWCQFEILFFLKLVGVYVFLNTPVFGQDLDMTRRRSYWLVRARNLCWYFHTLTDLAPNTLPAASIMIFARICKFAKRQKEKMIKQLKFPLQTTKFVWCFDQKYTRQADFRIFLGKHQKKDILRSGWP